MARDLNQGFKAFGDEFKEVGQGFGRRFKGLWEGIVGAPSQGVNATRGLLDRTAGAASFFLKPVKWVANSPFLGTATILGGAAVAAVAVKNHFDRKREAVNAMGLDSSQMPYPSYANSVSPEEYAQMEAKMRASASPQFAQAEAEKRTAAPTQQPQPAAISPL